LDFHVDESQLWHSSEAVKQRISAMAAVAHETAHLLDEQAAEAERIAKQLKSL
jgi:methyl-accepting chemotaxis protein